MPGPSRPKGLAPAERARLAEGIWPLGDDVSGRSTHQGNFAHYGAHPGDGFCRDLRLTLSVRHHAPLTLPNSPEFQQSGVYGEQNWQPRAGCRRRRRLDGMIRPGVGDALPAGYCRALHRRLGISRESTRDQLDWSGRDYREASQNGSFRRPCSFESHPAPASHGVVAASHCLIGHKSGRRCS